jgi:stearoyl-CoA desaturase (delta-9 desaturase)
MLIIDERETSPFPGKTLAGPANRDPANHDPLRPREARQVKPASRELDWINLIFLVFAHCAAAVGVWWAVVHFNPWTIALALTWLVLCSIGITAGYHRLFSHRTYQSAAWVRLVALLFGAASVQNSALRWANEHRVHHSKVDRDEDPYNIHRGFFWAHIGWVLYKNPDQGLSRVRELQADPLVTWQHRHYVPLAVLVGAVVPFALGALWGDALGGLLIAGFVRLVLQYHATFATNSLAHTLGSRPYDRTTSARDSFFTALFTFGEGYHNFHHRFPNDYRNGVRRWHFDPTKWLIFALSKVGATRGLKRVAKEKIERAERLAAGPRGVQTPAASAAPLAAEDRLSLS